MAKRKYTPRYSKNTETPAEAGPDKDLEAPPNMETELVQPEELDDETPVQVTAPVEEDEPRKKGGRPRKRLVLQDFTTEGDLIDIWERRMLNPLASSSAPAIRIKTPGMKLRWINRSQPGRYQRARYEQGWVPVARTELADEHEVFGVNYTTEGWVVRGEKQNEMLMKIPQAVFNKIQERRVEMRNKSYANVKDSLRQSGAAHFKEKYGGSAGDQAADAAGRFVGEIKFGSERATSDELLAE